jgi:3-hydroxybutyryl-CoA dehydrogenase
MKILVIGEKIKRQELISWISSEVVIDELDDKGLTAHNIQVYDCIFDLDFDSHTHRIKYFADYNIPVIVSAVKVQLAQVVHDYARPIKCLLFGMNCMPGFINRAVAEVSAYSAASKPTLQLLFDKLGKKIEWVEDRVGLVTPRIVCMIINEACYTVQEGTATIADIDTAMKLGTNYPFGPFEWANKIGVKHVYETLLAVYTDTNDERYKICPLLKTKYLRNENF